MEESRDVQVTGDAEAANSRVATHPAVSESRSSSKIGRAKLVSCLRSARSRVVHAVH